MVVFHLFSLHLLKLLSLICLLSSQRYLTWSLLFLSSGSILYITTRAKKNISRSIVMNNLLDHLSAVRIRRSWNISSSAIHWLDWYRVMSWNILLGVIELWVIVSVSTSRKYSSITLILLQQIVLRVSPTYPLLIPLSFLILLYLNNKIYIGS